MTDFLMEMIMSSARRADAARLSTPLSRPENPGVHGRLRAALAAPAAAAHEAGEPAPLAIIAEIKRRSPSKGDIAPDLDAVERARAYEEAGAEAISVLTEPDRFGGSMDDLRAVAAAVEVPVLRKDFIIDPYQIWEAAEAGASAVLLIAAALPSGSLGALLDECHDCGIDALVEVHDADDLERAYSVGASMMGVNNRDLRTLEVDLAVSEDLGALIGACVLFISESGIGVPGDARRVRAAGAQAILVGEALVGTPHGHLATVVASLRGLDRPGGGVR
jgi:indole-3-glycerol phosphate synthase